MNWSSERQSSRPGGASSSPLSTVPPVVVIPDTDSKTASARPTSMEVVARKGMAPTAAVVSHIMLTSRKAKRGELGGGRPWVASITAKDRPPRKKAEKAKARQSSLP